MENGNTNTQKSRFHDPAQSAVRRESAPQGDYRQTSPAAPKRTEVKWEAETENKPSKAESKRREKRKGSKKGCLRLAFAALMLIVLGVVAALIVSAIYGGVVHQLPTIERENVVSEVLQEGEYASAPQDDFVAKGAVIPAIEEDFAAAKEVA